MVRQPAARPLATDRHRGPRAGAGRRSGAFALILNAAGISWTMFSEIAGYDSINYGLWYDDAQFEANFLSIAHTDADIDETCSAAGAALDVACG
jgi:hypothetical protein